MDSQNRYQLKISEQEEKEKSFEGKAKSISIDASEHAKKMKSLIDIALSLADHKLSPEEFEVQAKLLAEEVSKT